MPPQPPASKKPLVFGKEEKKSPLAKAAPWIFVAIAVLGIVLMVVFNPKQKSLVCHNGAGASAGLTSFGTCSEE